MVRVMNDDDIFFVGLVGSFGEGFSLPLPLNEEVGNEHFLAVFLDNGNK